MLFAKRDELIYLLFEFSVCFIAFDSTLKWVKIEFFIKGEYGILFRLECDYKWQMDFSSTNLQKRRVMNASLSAFQNQICAASIFGTYRSLVQWYFSVKCDFRSISKIKKQIKSSASFKLCINKFCVHERKDKVKIK